MKVDEAIARDLAARGVRALFMLQSEEILRLGVRAREHGIAVYLARHEAAAVGMADGYARASGNVGVAVIGRGPALTNSLTALITASKAGSPVLVLAGDTPTTTVVEPAGPLPDNAQDTKRLRQGPLLEALGVRTVTLRDPASAAANVGAALAWAASGATIAVNMPWDVLEKESADGPATLAPAERVVTVPDAAAIAEVADVLEASFAAQRPLILAGHGAVRAGAGPDLRALGERTGALLATTLKARSLFAGDPWDLGVCGTFADPVASELLVPPDLVLAFGASLNQHTTYNGTLLAKARVIQFDENPASFGRFRQAALTVRGDVRLAAAALVAELDRRGRRATGQRTAAVAARLGGARVNAHTDVSRPDVLDPWTLMRRIDRLLPLERTIVQDSAHHQLWSIEHLRVPDPRGFIFPREGGAVGAGTYVALGAAVARPDRLTVLCIGDGGVMMSLTDFETAVRYGLRLLVLISNNQSFGAEHLILERMGLAGEFADFRNPSFEALGKALGAEALTIRTLEEIDGLAARVAAARGPLFVDCRVAIHVD